MNRKFKYGFSTKFQDSGMSSIAKLNPGEINPRRQIKNHISITFITYAIFSFSVLKLKRLIQVF